MNTFNISQAAKIVGRTVKTLQRLDREKILIARRTSTGRRYYSESDIRSFMGESNALTLNRRRRVAYLRVSSVAQRPDLKNQRRVVEEFCVAKGLENVEYVEEIKGGLNFKRPLFASLMDSIEREEVETLVVAHKDRLCRFGIEWFERHCERHGCGLVVLNTEKLSPEQEMVQDLMTIVHCFSSRLYGLRNYKKALSEALKQK